MKTNVHLFEDCKWTSAVWQAMHQWKEVLVRNIGIVQVLKNIKGNRWSNSKKRSRQLSAEQLYTTLGVLGIRGDLETCVHTEEAVTQIKKKISERLHLLSSSKRANKCRHFIQHLLCN
ncbi:hypothetical protein H5410_009997 [Solanum commersonii]|uniref:Uncharacterized protein n=1 Tax=Solanum commersonii TaxID=4109 RepID=A0A9J6AKD5_SOLCO|nr:hypothetical protein H5410_009997 [Solanum commersonii]